MNMDLPKGVQIWSRKYIIFGLTIEKQLQNLQMEVFVHFVCFQASLCLFAWGPQ